MSSVGFFVLGKRIVSLISVLLACGFILFGSSPADAAGNPATPVFKDPYGGGIKLPNGGGEPGKAYMAFIKAAYRKDHRQLCILMGAEAAELDKCLEQKEALEGFIALFTQPKGQEVLGGYMKGGEATLDVLFTPHEGAPANGFIVMKKTGNRWMIASAGGSGSATVSAEAGATVDLADGSGTAGSRVAQAPEPEYTGPAPGRWTFAGDDDQGDAWTGTIDIGKLDPDYYATDPHKFHVVLEMKSGRDEERGIDTPCDWESGKREISCRTDIGEYTAVLSADRKHLTAGKWNALEQDWSTRKTTVIKTGTWTAVHTGGGATN